MSKTRLLEDAQNKKIERLEGAVAYLCDLLHETNPHIAEQLAEIGNVVISPLPD